MAKLKLSFTTTPNSGIYSRINVTFNGVKIEDNLQLSAAPFTKTYDVTGLDQNSLVIDNINNAADPNPNPPPDWINKRLVTLVGLDYASNNVDYKSYLPQEASKFTVPSGPNAGTLDATTALDKFDVHETNYELKFDSVGIFFATGCFIPTDILYRELPGNTYYSFATNHIYDLNGDIIG